MKYGVRCYECDKYITGKVLQVNGLTSIEIIEEHGYFTKS